MGGGRFRIVGDRSAQRQWMAPAPQPMTTGNRATTVSPHELANRGRPRSARLMQAVRNLDLAVNETHKRALLNELQAAYDERMAGVLTGLFSPCLLGHPYVDHRMTVHGAILEHFTADEVLPEPYGRARRLLQSGAYEFIEVYSDGAVVPVRADGTSA